MQHRRVTTLVALGVAVAGLVPAAVAGASALSPAAAGDEYCAAHLALEAAIANEDPEDDAAAAEAAMAAAPEDVAAALATAQANEPIDGPPSPEFTEAWGVVVDYVRENCGFAELNVLAQDYSFGGIGGEVAAGPTIINLANEGTEYHEIILFRRNEGTTETVDELLALPDEEVFTKIAFVGAAVAAPGETSAAVVDLTAGEYIGLCFIPVGSTPEALEEMMAAEGSAAPGPEATEGTAAEGTVAEGTVAEGTAPAETMVHDSTPPDVSMAPGEEGPPHFTQGMIVEFTVVEGGATDTGAADTTGMTATEVTEGAEDTTAGTTATTTG